MEEFADIFFGQVSACSDSESLLTPFSFLLPKHKISQSSAVLVIAARPSYSVPSTLQRSALLSVDPEFFQFHQCNQHFSSS